MEGVDFLYKKFDGFKEFLGSDHFQNLVSKDLISNLNPKFEIREYQKEALGRLVFYFSPQNQNKIRPTHLLFNMATGSGKTLVMAGAILDLYKQGYKNFIFFVKSNSIITKTKDNFLKEFHPKYLFNSKIIIDGNEIKIKEVSNFDSSSEGKNEISILFTTTSQLHLDLNTVKENKTSYEDLADKKVVLIADEAHNLQADILKKKSKSEEEESQSWQSTARKILNLNKDNILLEFTATARLNDERVAKEYENKALYRYELKSFREEGYSKDVDVLEVNSGLMDRVLVAILLSQYRRKVAEKYKKTIKPVILFKANQITIPKDTSKLKGENPKIVVSSIFKRDFHKFISELKVSHIESIKNTDNEEVKKVFDFLKQNEISLSNFVAEIKSDFAEEMCITVDDDKDIEKYQREINNLENNEYRAVFATEKLNEGWDVLNLYDIVRLYDTRDSKDNEAGKGTVMEAQLIGRGARYFPFKIEEQDDKYKRKFDKDADNELRILERLFFHSAKNVKYVQELKAEMTRQGIITANNQPRHLKIKGDFKESTFWKSGYVFRNERVLKSYNEGLFSDFSNRIKKETLPPFKVKSGEALITRIFDNKESVSTDSDQMMTTTFGELGSNIVRHALSKLNLDYSKINQIFSDIDCIEDFICSERYLSDFKITFQGSKGRLQNLTQDDKLNASVFALNVIFSQLQGADKEYKGTKEFKPYKISEVLEDRTLLLDLNSERAKEFDDVSLADADWYAQNEVWGTSEERDFLRFMNAAVQDLKKQYSAISVVRNERFVQIYTFDEGNAFEPDFILFLEDSKQKKKILYQVFIEPKGNQFKGDDGTFDTGKEAWKQKFLKEIEDTYQISFKFENKDFKLIGLPFFNKDSEDEFIQVFNSKLIKASK
jgi:type III restriction enzyme